tara:strand:- start:368 stop:1315 length:948 start_codon:yes stop_codon:yes gene_type:complete
MAATEMENRDWCNNRTKQCAVLYLAGEGHQGMRTRVRAWQQHHGVSLLDFHILPSAIELDQRKIADRLIEDISELGINPDLVVIDTLHRYFSGDENSARDAKSLLDTCGKLMHSYGCTVVLVHHTGLAADAQNRARGSSAWRGALDIEVSVKPKNTTRPIEVVQRKMKDAEEAHSRFFELTKVAIKDTRDEDGNLLSSVVMQETDKPKRISTKAKRRDDSKSRFERAWINSSFGRDWRNRPHVKRAFMIEFLQSPEIGMELSSAKKALQPDGDRLIASLLKAGLIEIYEEGWSAKDEDFKVYLSSVSRKKDKEDI